MKYDDAKHLADQMVTYDSTTIGQIRKALSDLWNDDVLCRGCIPLILSACQIAVSEGQNENMLSEGDLYNYMF